MSGSPDVNTEEKAIYRQMIASEIFRRIRKINRHRRGKRQLMRKLYEHYVLRDLTLA